VVSFVEITNAGLETDGTDPDIVIAALRAMRSALGETI
jgi:hypothetical protein